MGSKVGCSGPKTASQPEGAVVWSRSPSALNLRRAESVKAYLVTSGGLDAMKVNATGKGEGSPTTQAGDCKGNGATTALIACLQPDRRVDIEVTGSR